MTQESTATSTDGKKGSSVDHVKIKEKKDRSLPPTKVVVRRLPPTMTQETFVEQVSPLPDHDYMYFVKGDMSLGQFAFSRAYINFINQEDIFLFKDKFDGYVFVDQKGNEFPAVVEFAPFQKIPKRRTKKRDAKCGTLETDPDYLKFLETFQETQDVTLPTTQDCLEEIEAKERELKANNGVLKVTTPLIEFIKQRKAERQRIKEEKREERKRRELERKKTKEEERKKRKEAKEKEIKEREKREREKREAKKELKEKEAKEKEDKQPVVKTCDDNETDSQNCNSTDLDWDSSSLDESEDNLFSDFERMRVQFSSSERTYKRYKGYEGSSYHQSRREAARVNQKAGYAEESRNKEQTEKLKEGPKIGTSIPCPADTKPVSTNEKLSKFPYGRVSVKGTNNECKGKRNHWLSPAAPKRGTVKTVSSQEKGTKESHKVYQEIRNPKGITETTYFSKPPPFRFPVVRLTGRSLPSERNVNKYFPPQVDRCLYPTQMSFPYRRNVQIPFRAPRNVFFNSRSLETVFEENIEPHNRGGHIFRVRSAQSCANQNRLYQAVHRDKRHENVWMASSNVLKMFTASKT